MKIGVVTFWYGNSNYGMIMQCWALQQYLKKMGHDPYVIRFKPERPIYITWAKEVLLFLLSFSSKAKRIEYKKNRALLNYNLSKDNDRRFDLFRKERLSMTSKKYTSISSLRSDPPIADCYIAGSDQIWCYDLHKDKNAMGYFLDFGKDSTRRISYAPSFGKLTYSANNNDLLIRALDRIDFISCRENSGVDVCRMCGFDSEKVEDPTLLLSKDEYESLCEKTPENNYIFIYSVNIGSAEDIYWDALRSTFANKSFVVIPASGSISGGELFGDQVEYKYATPGEWLATIKNSEMVITSSFHGVVFSIIFNKNFAFVPIKGAFSATNNRIYDLLMGLNLSDHVVREPGDYIRLFNKAVDWERVNIERNRLIKNSVAFLDKAIAMV